MSDIEIMQQLRIHHINDRCDGHLLKEVITRVIEALEEKQARENPQPLTLDGFETICENVHNGWWMEKIRQGVTDHPDMIEYSKLSESVKEYDRVTVRRVLDALGVACDHPPKEDTK